MFADGYESHLLAAYGIGDGHNLGIANREQAVMGAIERKTARTVATGQRPDTFNNKLCSIDHGNLSWVALNIHENLSVTIVDREFGFVRYGDRRYDGQA